MLCNDFVSWSGFVPFTGPAVSLFSDTLYKGRRPLLEQNICYFDARIQIDCPSIEWNSYISWFVFRWNSLFFLLNAKKISNPPLFFWTKKLFWHFHIQIEFPSFEWKSSISWFVFSWNSLFFLLNSKKLSNPPFKTKKKTRMSSFCCIKPPQVLLYLNKFF